MGRRGRKPKPNALKLLEGTRADRVNLVAPAPVRMLPDPPKYLDEDGLAAWNRMAPRLDAIGLLTELDAEALGLYCSTYSRWLKAQRELAGGCSIMTDRGTEKSNPAAAVVAECSRLMASLLAEFGLTPASRSRVQASAAPPRDALAEFLARRKG